MQGANQVERIGVREAKQRFSELLSLSKTGKRFIIERRGRPVAALVSAEGWDDEGEEPVEREPKGLLTVLGVLTGHEDFFQAVEHAYRSRDVGREVDL